MLKEAKKIHLVGVKGVGMTALAQILLSRKVKLSGSDTKESFFTDKVLKKLGLRVRAFSSKNIGPELDLVIASAAYFEPGKALGKGGALDSSEVKKALKLKIPVISYAQAIAMIARDYKLIAVAGSHGKSTTTAMLGWMLERAGESPSVIVGTKVKKWESNARLGKSRYLIVEADEYKESFLNYSPFGAIITSIDYDHPDYFKSRASYYSAFRKLVNRVEKGGFLIGFGDDGKVRRLLKYGKKRGLRTLSYGFLKGNKLRLYENGVFHAKQLFHVLFHARKLAGKVGFPGWHYVANSGAVLAAAKMLKISMSRALLGIASFPGTARRFDVLRKSPAIVIDDYAHHPSEIRASLSGVRALYPKRNLVVIFQPHTFSRTRALMKDFQSAFTLADELAFMEIYSSAREKKAKISSRDLAKKVKNSVFLRNRAEARKFFSKQAKKKDNVVLLMGAGDVYEIAD